MMANKELQEWNITSGDNRLFEQTTHVREVPNRLNDLQAAVKNFNKDSVSFSPHITYNEAQNCFVVRLGTTSIRRYDFLTDNTNPLTASSSVEQYLTQKMTATGTAKARYFFV